ncbi:MAG: alpha/beta hydrolase, partial [Deltaproteobacteria bacterium]|nr:alpha/beta hydrolase [Deltaproteobacteria bacterium]
MLKKFNRLLGACVCLLMLSGSLASAYDYPFADPYVATILGTPKEYAYDLPKEVPLKYDTIKMFPDRKVPGILWNL